MNEQVMAYIQNYPPEIAALFLELRRLVFSVSENAEEKLWAKLPSYYSGARFIRLIPFRDHINIEARAVLFHCAALAGYKITPKGMLQIYIHQEIPDRLLIPIFSETLNG